MGMGPGYAELSFEERPSEPVICFLADKTEPGAWNMALYKMFADPFNTAGPVIDAKMHQGFVFEVYDLYEDKRIFFDLPADLYDLLMFIGAPARFVVHSVRSKTLDIIAAATSTQRLSLIAGKYVGKDDPVMIVRAQSGLPAVGEVLEPFAFPYAVAGCMRGSHHAPLMPVSLSQATPTRFDGPPRVVALGFQIHQGKLLGPRDMFADVSFDRLGPKRTRRWTTSAGTGRSSRTGCRSRIWNTRQCATCSISWPMSGSVCPARGRRSRLPPDAGASIRVRRCGRNPGNACHGLSGTSPRRGPP